MTRTCAACGWRDSVDVTDWDGRMIPICSFCMEPPDVPEGYEYEPADIAERFDPTRDKKQRDHSSRDAVFAAVVERGQATAADIAERLGVSDWRSREYDVVTNHLRLLVKSGCLGFTMIPGSKGFPVRLYQATGKQPEAKMHTHRQKIVELRRDGMRPIDIAKRLGTTKSAVNSHLYEARQRGELPPAKRAA